MPRSRTPAIVQPTPRAHESLWPEVALLGAFLVICLLSVLTVLLPATENEEEHGKANPPSSNLVAQDN